MVLHSDEAVPLKVLVCQGVSKGSSAEVLSLGMPYVALILRPKIQRLRLHLSLYENLHSICRAPVWLVDVKLGGPKDRIWDLVQYHGGSDSCPLRGRGVDVDRS